MEAKSKKSKNGQESDDMGAHNERVFMQGQQVDSYHARGEDFPLKKEVNESGMATWGNFKSGGHNELIKASENQDGPRHAEDEGSGKPVDKNSARVAANFKVTTNKGEGAEAPEKMSAMVGVDCSTGKISVDGYSSTPVGEVGGIHVSIGK